MNFSLEKSIALLARSPRVYDSLIGSLWYDMDSINEGEGTWSARNILGHLIHGEKTDWIPRAEIILSDKADKTFEPYDRFAQDRLYNTQSTNELLQMFLVLRRANLDKLKSWNLSESELNKTGVHPDLGVVSLRSLIATWTIHDLVHLNQLTRVFAKHYREDVGPWLKYNRLIQ